MTTAIYAMLCIGGFAALVFGTYWSMGKLGAAWAEDSQPQSPAPYSRSTIVMPLTLTAGSDAPVEYEIPLPDDDDLVNCKAHEGHLHYKSPKLRRVRYGPSYGDDHLAELWNDRGAGVWNGLRLHSEGTRYWLVGRPLRSGSIRIYADVSCGTERLYIGPVSDALVYNLTVTAPSTDNVHYGHLHPRSDVYGPDAERTELINRVNALSTRVHQMQTSLGRHITAGEK